MDFGFAFRARTKTCPLFVFPAEDSQLGSLTRSTISSAWLRPASSGAATGLPFPPPRVRTKTCPLFVFPV